MSPSCPVGLCREVSQASSSVCWEESAQRIGATRIVTAAQPNVGGKVTLRGDVPLQSACVSFVCRQTIMMNERTEEHGPCITPGTLRNAPATGY